MHSENNYSLRKFNNALSIIVAILAIYIILIPVLPNIAWWLKQNTPIYSNSVVLPPKEQDNEDNRPVENTLIIPAMDFKKRIYSGDSSSVLSQGLWQLPNVGDPSSGGNTVIAGHRFTYNGPDVFYHLDKVKTGDDITIYWQKQRLDYKVQEIKVVKASEISVQQNTLDTRLTLITCTPLWSAKDRLVVTAKLTEVIK